MSATPQHLRDTLYLGNPTLVKTRDFHDIDVTTNRLIFVFLVLISGYQFLVAPLLISISLWFVLTLLPTLLFSSTTGVMVHEAIHGLLYPAPLKNRRMGQVMALFMGIAYNLQRFDHLRHHRISRTSYDCDEVYIVPRRSMRKVSVITTANYLVRTGTTSCRPHSSVFLPTRFIYPVMSFIYGPTIVPSDHSALSIILRNQKLSALVPRVPASCCC